MIDRQDPALLITECAATFQVSQSPDAAYINIGACSSNDLTLSGTVLQSCSEKEAWWNEAQYHVITITSMADGKVSDGFISTCPHMC